MPRPSRRLPGKRTQEDDGDDEGQKAKGSSNTKKPRTQNTTAKYEKEVKEFLAMEQSSDNRMTTITAEVKKNPSWWTWAKDAILTHKEARAEVLKVYADQPHFQNFKVAALSQKEMAKLRKDLDDQYVPKLLEYITSLGPKIQVMSEAALQIDQMATAKKGASALVSAPTAKPKGKAQARCGAKHGDSSTSLQA